MITSATNSLNNSNDLGLESAAVYLDGANVYHSARALGYDIDYKKLLAEFKTSFRLIRAYYYTAVPDESVYSPLRPLVDWLDYNGYTVVTKQTKEFTGADGKIRVKGNMDIDIAVGMLEMAPFVQRMVLFSGDGDFRPLVEAVQRKGVHVTVVSTIQSQPSMIADDLRRQADTFLDLAHLRDAIGRDGPFRGSVDDEPLSGLPEPGNS